MTIPPASPPNRALAGALWMLGSVAMFVVMSVSGRGLKGQHEVFEIMVYRSIISLLAILTLCVLTRQLGQITARNFGQQLLRNTIHFTGQWLWFWALMVIPLAQLFALEFTSPIWIVLLAPFFLGEALNRIRVLATILGFIGILIVANPDFGNVDLGILAAAGAAFFFAASIILTKRMTQSEGVVSIMFWQALLQIPMGLAAAYLWGEGLRLPDAQSAWLLLAVGLSAFGAHFCLAKALSVAPASLVMPFDLLRLPVAAVVGWLLYSEAVEITLFIGAGLIILGNWINIRYGANKPARSEV